MLESTALVLMLTFLSVSVITGLSLCGAFGRDGEVAQRISELKGPRDSAARSRFYRSRRTAQNRVSTSLARFGSRLLPGSSSAREQLIERFVHAGIYSPAGPSIYTSVRLVVGIGFPLIAALAGSAGLFDRTTAICAGSLCGLLGIAGSSVWLRRRVSRRQRQLRRSLPDFLDLTGTCLQAGQSFEAALARVTEELQSAHLELAVELRIVQREMALGATPTRALRNFAQRSGLDVVRQLATLVDQSQRLGASMTESLRIHSETLRTQRSQQAEMLAQKASVKVLIPTLLFIFPPVLVILVGPAAIDLHETFVKDPEASESR
jgi:tight adherence protein C